MKIPHLHNFEKWKTLNKDDFSYFDYLFHILSEIDSDIFFAFFEMFWPTFLEKDGYVFVKELFSEEKYQQLVQNQSKVEYWMNLLTVDDFFQEDNWRERASAFAQSLVEIWGVKLKREFPDRKFQVKYQWDEDTGDYGLTFYQINEVEV